MENIVIQTKLKTIPKSCTKCKYSYVNNDGRFCSVKFVKNRHMKIPYEYVPEVNNYCYIKPEEDCPLKMLENTVEKETEISQEVQKFNPHTDKLFLLSKDEYKSVEENIKKYCTFPGNDYWWLRSPNCSCFNYVYCVPSSGPFRVSHVDSIVGVAPAFIEDTRVRVGTTKIKYGFPFVYVGKNIWMPESFIFYSRFAKNSNNYETSEVRERILEWAEERGE